MKKLFFVLFASALVFASCDKSGTTAAPALDSTKIETAVPVKASPKELVTGTWKFSNMESPAMAAMLSDAKMKAEWDKTIAEQQANNSMTINADGTYITKASMQGKVQESTGTWTISEDGKTFMSTDSQTKKTDNLTIESVDPLMLTLSIVDHGDKMTMTYKK
jgi:hypothetical protein